MPPRNAKRAAAAGAGDAGQSSTKKRPADAKERTAASDLQKSGEPANAADAQAEGDAELPRKTSKNSANRRTRWAPEDSLRDAVIGYIGDDEEDPPQAGQAVPRQSREIQQLISEGVDVPVAKDQRSKYVWVALARGREAGSKGDLTKEAEPAQRTKKYTWNAEEIVPVDTKLARDIDLRCDLCGLDCTEVLYEFRCYPRMRAKEPRPAGGRRLHPFVSYISKECGKGLLGLQTEASKLRESIYRLVSDDNNATVETLQELWRHATKSQKLVLEDELRYLAKPEAGMSRRAAELKKAEAMHGELHKEREDVFRALARALAPGLNARDLAAVTVHPAEQEDETVERPDGAGKSLQATEGYLGQVVEALRDRRPLPTEPVPWDRQDVVTCLRSLVGAWAPLRVELHDSLSGVEVFQHQKESRSRKKQKKKQKKHKEEPEEAEIELKLVFLPGCGELHGVVAQKCSKEQVQALKSKREELLQQCREDYSLLETFHGGQGRYSRAEDRAIDLPEEGQVRFEHVEKALGQITWPNCFTRNNVKPDGAPFIEAFPLGIVLNYCLGLVCSRATRLWPTLTKLLAKFIQQEQPDFRYTTMQLNKNYATKMHVDANNHGPSFIIGLGDYTGGEVWIYDENGTVEMELPCALRGWSHLRPGQKVPGRLEDCRNKWLKFDGNTPHMTMPYTGSRISIVYFTRKGWLTMLPETKDTLETSGFMLPGEDYQSLCTTKEDAQAQAKKVAKAPRKIASAQDQIAIDSDDEVDEDEQVDEVLRAEQDSAAWPSGEWARGLRRFLYDSSSKLVDDAHELNVTICGSATCAGIALQEFLSEVAPFTISSAHVSGGSGPLRLLKRTCKPQHVFCDLNAALAGSGHCEVQHKACESTRTANQDFLFASFPCEPFLNLDPSKPSCFDDPKSATFLSVRSHLGLRRPRGCLLHCEGWHLLPEASRPSVYSFLMEGEDPRRSEDRQVDWGLSRLENYGVAFVELPLMKFGVPLAGPDAYVILIRADCGGHEAADAAAKLMQAIGELKLPGERKLLPSCTVGALMLPEEDPRVVNGVREAKQLEKAERAAGGRRKAPKSNTRQLTVEARELGLQPGDARYTEFLRGSKPPRDKWLKQAAPDKVVVLNLIYERCRQSGQDISNLCADLSQGFQAIGRRDDGLLPRPSHVSKASSDRPDYYAFSHHRALVGQEILLCHGYPIWRMDFRGLSEAEVLQLAAGSPAVPAVGAGVAAIFAVVDLGPGRNLKLPKSRLHELVKDFAEPVVQASLTAPSTETAEALKFGSVPDEDDARLESKAAALLNLVSHGAFGEAEKADSNDKKAKPGEAAQKIISVLSAVAQPDDGDQEEGRGTKRKQEETAVAESPAVVFEEPLDWQVRLRKLNFGVDPISLDMIIKWVTEAAEDSQAQFSAEIIKSGIAEFLRRVSKEAIPEVLVRERQAFTSKLKEAGFADMAKALDLAIRSMQFSERLQKGSSQTCLDMQTKQSMPAYMNMVVRGCDRQGWPMRRVFLGHLSRVASKSAEGEADGSAPSEALVEFGKAGGWKYVMSWLDEEPQPTTWPPYSVLDELGSNIPSVAAPLKLFALLHRVLTHPGFASSMPAPCLSRLERQLTRAAAPALDLNQDEPGDEKLQRKLHDIASLGGQVGNLFEFLEKLLAFASKVRHPKLGDSTPGTTAWLDLQSESRDLVCAYKGLADQPAFGWTSILKLVAGLTQDLDEIIRENIKAAQQRAANVKEEERARLLDEAKARVEANTGTVLSLLANGKLRERSSSGLQDCLGKMKRLGDSMQHLEQLDKSEKSSQSVDAWEEGRAAVKGFCQLKVRCSKALHWLQKRQLGHCAKLLDSAGLLETLDLVKDAQKLKTLGLPFRCQELLVSCAENDGLSPGHLEPKLEEVPDVWEQRTSRNLNLQYFQKVGSSAMSWEWPLPTGLVPWRTDGSAGELLQQQEEDQLLASARRISGAPRPGGPAFVDEGSCLLCQQDATDLHWASPEHRKHAAYWKQLADRLAMICVDLQRLPEEASQSGLAAAWRGELWQALRMPPLPPSAVLAVFWRRVVLWSLSASCPTLLDHDADTVDGLRERLQYALSVAKIAEKEQDRREEHERALAKVKAQAAKLVPLIDPDRLRKKAAHISEAVAAFKEARLALVAAPLHTRSSSIAYAVATLRRSEAAIQKACLEPSFNVNVRSWLRKHQLDSCFDVLAVRGVLESLQLKEMFQADATQSLPGRFVDALAKALYEGGDLRRVHGTRQLPNGWEMVYSRSAGLFYYHEIPKGGVQNGRTQWQFPDLQAESSPEVPNALTACERGIPCNSVPYVELDSGGEPLCLLCGQRGLEHFAGAAHADKILTWSGIHQRLSQVLRELSAQAMLPASSGGKALEEDAALAKVWLEEARRAVFDSDAEHQDVEVCRIFWHLLLEPFFKAVRLLSVKEGLDRAIYFSGLPEPKWADMPWRMPLPPRPGQDFTWPYHSSLKLSPSTPREVFNALSAQALLQEGLAPQEGEHRGGLWCSFCCKPVKILQEHLDRTSREAQEHMRAKISCQAVVDKLRVGGWRLRREGLQILKQRFYCGLCNASGSWMQIWDHHRSHHHQNAYMALQSSRSPAALQAQINNEQFKEAEEKAWQAAFDADRNAVM